MVAGLTDGCDMRCQRQLAVDDDANVASRFRGSDARAEHQDFLARDLYTAYTAYRIYRLSSQANLTSYPPQDEK